MGTEKAKNIKLTKDTVSVKFTLSKKLHKELKLKAVQDDKTIQQVLENLVSEWTKK